VSGSRIVPIPAAIARGIRAAPGRERMWLDQTAKARHKRSRRQAIAKRPNWKSGIGTGNIHARNARLEARRTLPGLILQKGGHAPRFRGARFGGPMPPPAAWGLVVSP